MTQPHHEREVFLAAIHAAPEDLTARLVYADWLDERAEPEGELVRLLCEVQSSNYEDGPAWKRLRSLAGGLHSLAMEIGRLCERDRRSFGCDCAERVLPLLQEVKPADDRIATVIMTSRRFADGRATRDRLLQAEAAAGEVVRELRRLENSLGDRTERAAVNAAADAAVAAMHAAGMIAWASRAAAAAASSATIALGLHGAPAATERRWQLCRAIEYRLGFVPPLESGEQTAS